LTETLAITFPKKLMMPNSTNLRNGDSRQSPRRSDPRGTDRSLDIESGDEISKFLTNAVVARFNRERTPGLAFDDDQPEHEIPAKGNGAGSVDVRILPPAENRLDRGSSMRLPTWKR